MTEPWWAKSEPDPVEQFRYRTLDWLKYGLAGRIPENLVVSADFRAGEDFFRDEIVWRLSTKLLHERLPDRYYTASDTVWWDFPRSPFQHWKRNHAESWWLGWFVRRWPIKTDRIYRTATMEVDINDYLTYPYQTIADPRMGDAVRIPEIRQQVTWKNEP